MKDHTHGTQHKEKLHRRHGKKAVLFLIHPETALEEKAAERLLILKYQAPVEVLTFCFLQQQSDTE